MSSGNSLSKGTAAGAVRVTTDEAAEAGATAAVTTPGATAAATATGTGVVGIETAIGAIAAGATVAGASTGAAGGGNGARASGGGTRADTGAGCASLAGVCHSHQPAATPPNANTAANASQRRLLAPGPGRAAGVVIWRACRPGTAPRSRSASARFSASSM